MVDAKIIVSYAIDGCESIIIEFGKGSVFSFRF